MRKDGRNKARRIFPAGEANLEYYQAWYTTHAFSRHWHDGYGIGVIEAGCEMFQYGGTMQYAPAGSLVLVNPGVVHTGEAVDQGVGWRYRIMFPSVERVRHIVEQAFSQRGRELAFPAAVVQDPAGREAALRMFHVLEEGRDFLACQSVLMDTLAFLLQRHGRMGPVTAVGREDRTVARLRDYLHQHYRQNITLEELAAAVGRSPFHLQRVFERQVGMTPHVYQMFLRVRLVRQLLNRQQPVALAAAEAGFADQSHMSRYFKRIVGVTPGEYMGNH